MPSTSIDPWEGSSRKLMQRNKVLFPEPLRPIRQTTCFSGTSRLTLFSTCRRPKYLSRLEIFTMGGMLSLSFREAGFEAIAETCENMTHGQGISGYELKAWFQVNAPCAIARSSC